MNYIDWVPVQGSIQSMSVFYGDIASLVQVVITFCIYVLTSFPSISGGDSGELASIACTGGVAHPPGYPLWLMLARINLWLTQRGSDMLIDSYVPDAAYRLNIMSAVFSSLAVGVLLSMIRALSNSLLLKSGSNMTDVYFATILGSIFAGALYSFSGGIWEFSTQAEVFALNNLLIALLLRAQLSALLAASHHRMVVSKAKSTDVNEAENSVIRNTSVLALVSGLCLTNQHTSVVYVVIAAIPVVWAGRGVWTTRATLTGKALCCYSCSALVGLAPYLYLPITARSKPLDSWGDQRSIEGFLTHFLRKEYGTFKLASELGEEQDLTKIMSRFAVFFSRFSQESLGAFVGPSFALIGVGLVIWISLTPLFEGTIAVDQNSKSKKKKPQSVKSSVWTDGGCGLLLLLQVSCYSLLINGLANLSFSALHLNITSRMWQQAFYIGFVFVGVGASRVILLAMTLMDHSSSNVMVGKSTGRVVVLAVVVGLASMQVGRFWAKNDQSSNDIFITYGRQVIEGLPAHALLLVNDDLNCNLPQYVLRCEHRRPDVQLVRLPLITYGWWRHMQLHHYSHLNTSGPTEQATDTTKKKRKVLLARDGWHMYGSVHPEINDQHVTDMKLKYTSQASDQNPKKLKTGDIDRSKSLAFPGLKHHPHEKNIGSFSLDEFLNANIKHRSVFVAGEWKPGDSSGDSFRRLPSGLVERVLSPDAARYPLDQHSFINEGVFLLPTRVPSRLTALLSPGSDLSLDLGSWDYIVALKYYRGLFTAAQLLAEQINNLPPPTTMPNHTIRENTVTSGVVDLSSPNRIVLLRTASRAYDLLDTSGLCSSDVKSDFYCSPSLWRNAGIISAHLAADLDAVKQSNSQEEKDCVDRMFKFWARFVDGSKAGEGKDLIRGMKAGVNPVNQKVHPQPPWLKEWLKHK